jgi:hypothetical protein
MMVDRHHQPQFLRTRRETQDSCWLWARNDNLGNSLEGCTFTEKRLLIRRSP